MRNRQREKGRTMANRRMFSKDVVETDKFLNMPLTSQALYFHLGMEADDDGFIASPKKIQRSIGCSEGDLQLLASCGFIIPFESGVVVLTHWKQNNYIQADRYRKTVHKEEAALLQNDNYVYSLDTTCIQPVSNPYPQDRLGKDRLGKDSIYIPMQTSDSETGIFMILNDGSFYDVSAEKLAMWKQAYSELDVEHELYRMASWCDANPTKRKTRRGIEKFINGWLIRSQKEQRSDAEKETEKSGTEKIQNPEEDPEHVPDVREVWERLRREGRV